METVLDALVILLWITFSLATILGVIQEIQKSSATTQPELIEDDDTVYLLEPQTIETPVLEH
ncbi:MAG: hypothetical protein AAF587_24335 [Bacteroidota bacterium]